MKTTKMDKLVNNFGLKEESINTFQSLEGKKLEKIKGELGEMNSETETGEGRNQVLERADDIQKAEEIIGDTKYEYIEKKLVPDKKSFGYLETKLKTVKGNTEIYTVDRNNREFIKIGKYMDDEPVQQIEKPILSDNQDNQLEIGAIDKREFLKIGNYLNDDHQGETNLEFLQRDNKSDQNETDSQDHEWLRDHVAEQEKLAMDQQEVVMQQEDFNSLLNEKLENYHEKNKDLQKELQNNGDELGYGEREVGQNQEMGDNHQELEYRQEERK